jgi:excisionase family DNA binding protein
LRTKPGDAMSDVVQKAVATPAPPPKGRALSGNTHQPDRIEITVNGVRIDVSPELEDALLRAHNGLSRPLPKEMTTTQAAAFLDVSRPFVIKLIERGELPCRMVGKHRRLPGEAVLNYREKMFQRASKAADEMAQLAQDAGLYEQEPPRKAQ